MKFGLTLAESLVPEWREHYIDYESLKHKLKQVRLSSAAAVSLRGSAVACHQPAQQWL
jgi:SPX domain protein involved in polyphosphate accumulation